MNDTVLIVDDDEMVALGLQSLLGMEDIDAKIALEVRDLVAAPVSRNTAKLRV